MKLSAISLFALLSMAYGQEAERDLQASDRYYVSKYQASGAGFAGNSNKFLMTAYHEEGHKTGTYAGKVFMWHKVEKKCIQGATNANLVKIGTAAAMTAAFPSWLSSSVRTTVSIGTASNPNHKTSWILTVDPAVVNSPMWLPWSSGTGGEARFCTFFGLGDIYNPYGFRESYIIMKFQMMGGFSKVGFSTRAFSPTGGFGRKIYKAKGGLCSKQMVYYPGQVICARICPEDSTTYIKDVTYLLFTEVTKTSAPGGTSVIIGTPKPGTFDVPYYTKRCPYGAKAVNGACCEVDFILRSKYYPQWVLEKPSLSFFSMSGKGTFSCTKCGGKSLGGRRLEGEERDLQEEKFTTLEESELLDGEVEVEDEVEMTMQGGEADSSAGSIAAGAAAAAAMGAALLI